MTTALPLSASFMMMFLLFCISFRASFCLIERLFRTFVFFCRSRFHNFSKNMSRSLFLPFSGQNLDLFLTKESSLLSESRNCSFSLNLRSNSFRSPFRSVRLLLGVGQNFRPNFSISICSLFSLYEDRFIILGLRSFRLVLLPESCSLKKRGGYFFFRFVVFGDFCF